jgi:hypothetical protein
LYLSNPRIHLCTLLCLCFQLKRQVCSALAQTAKHSVDLAEVVVEAEIFPKVLACLKDMDLVVRKNAATLIREIAKHTPEVLLQIKIPKSNRIEPVDLQLLLCSC